VEDAELTVEGSMKRCDSRDRPNTRPEVESATRIFEEYGDLIRAIVLHNLSDREKANDILQDFYLSLVRKPIPADVRDVKSYLYRAITNDIIDAIRNERSYAARVNRYAETSKKNCVDYNDPQIIVSQGQEIQEMFRLIERQLPSREAEALTERFDKGSDIGEGAKRMGVNKRTFSRYACIGVKKIRDFLSQNDGDKNGCI
jgi:RNA polymerase sigma factor (sigma-70 family)